MDISEYFIVIIVILRPELAKIRDQDWDRYQEVGKILDRDWDSELIFFETETETQNIGIMRLRVSVSWVSIVILRQELAKIPDRDWDRYQWDGKIRDQDWDPEAKKNH